MHICIGLGQKYVSITSAPTALDLKHEYTQRWQRSRLSCIVHTMTAMREHDVQRTSGESRPMASAKFDSVP